MRLSTNLVLLAVSGVMTIFAETPKEPPKITFDAALAQYWKTQSAQWSIEAQFQRSLTDEQKNIQRLAAQNQQKLAGDIETLRATCSGKVTGIESGDPKCETKSPELRNSAQP